MRSTASKLPAEIMPFAVRPLKEADVHQSAEIERDAFPTLFPPTPFRRELKNRNLSFLVAWRRERVPANVQDSGPPGRRVGLAGQRLVGALLRNSRDVIGGSPTARGEQLIGGFVGVLYMVDEAHIISVGVRSAFRRLGVGELLVIGAIEQAIARGSCVVTLEVRPSNSVAINLYHKYGFTKRGRRKAYYADNREDAIIMTTDPIQHPDYRDFFEGLEQEHRRRWGHAERVVL
jgi:ribosomal-protein-alanine N-acetyltransferase